MLCRGVRAASTVGDARSVFSPPDIGCERKRADRRGPKEQDWASPEFVGQKIMAKIQREPASKRRELAYLKKKFGITGQAAAAAQRAGGVSRAKVEAFILMKRFGDL